jgi:hypothetical protein
VTAETITLIIAIWGALLSTLAIGWNLYRDLSDRGKLRVSCYIGLIVQEGVGIEKEDLLFWNVTNIGRQPVLLTNIGGQTEDSHFTVKTHQPLSMMLQPGEYFTDYVDDYSNIDIKNLKALTATDSVGKTYQVSRKQLKEVKERLIEIISKDNT